ncbi:glutathione S-transferase [Zymomonas mobilis subsp. mobilis ZM4 = ATCC 31821]|uniref:Glutathione S-transferase domain protein n=3 Tax=Zymomonas mobilis TaxID=542 RepID=H2VFR8_ZYMMO|nr:glutathione S-transferase family protein [Zymomonas mobilis]AAD53892.1 unknown [Zymomonas mobilis subsp. mobilis ZM4 = ATCC 31821]AAV89742.1 Glutathione S-transferase domain protein [Zymomonas mobilis subsp. mobilis ZM4 = ATCC 31821]ACV74757.1 Glutathione S-transferase domain protein [Zymomonas mobilis subsp. mobilis NCIMB 11163]AEH62059.1 Glutathione S-transferase domain-containing protein [Zymomonas mobilis subsp. mobilis ATCC 10988]AVZ26008.1 glutathione S-transferase [Zymomonas mobilis 
MWQLYQFPLCPFSRKVRFLLGEKGIGYELIRESPWLKRDEFVDMNPAGQTPVMVDSSAPVILVDSQVICEFLEETVDRMPLISGTAVHRAEIRRLVSLFDNKLYFEVTAPLMNERMLKRLVHRQAPDAAILRGAMKNANSHLDYIDWLLDHRRWLAGPVLSLADFAAAAQISVSDYLGGVDWRGHENSREWYAAMKSRPSFQPILAERMEVILPPDHYDQPDF